GTRRLLRCPRDHNAGTPAGNALLAAPPSPWLRPPMPRILLRTRAAWHWGIRLPQLSDSNVAAAAPAGSGLGSRALRNTALVLAAKVVARLIALVTVLYMIRRLGTDHYGSFTGLSNPNDLVSEGLDLAMHIVFRTAM